MNNFHEPQVRLNFELAHETGFSRILERRAGTAVQSLSDSSSTPQPDGIEGFRIENLKAVISSLGTINTPEDLKAMSISTDNLLVLGRVASQRKIFGHFTRTLISEAIGLIKAEEEDMTDSDAVTEACIDSSRLVLSLLVSPPEGIRAFERNPKQELPQTARLLLKSRLSNQPVPFVVPCCPDTSQYRLGDGLGEVIPKGIGYCKTVGSTCDQFGFDASFDLHVADVEGLDPVILHNSGETTESHFQKTAVTIEKTKAEVDKRNLAELVTVRGMNAAFLEQHQDYRLSQLAAAKTIGDTTAPKTLKTLELLLAERRKLRNFDHIDNENQRALVINELAGYAAYGRLIAGRAIILSPDAMSAIPAYHYFLNGPEQFSPVLYAR